jgi:elongation factor Ts
VAEELTKLVATIGENLQLRRAATVSVENGVVGTYMHAATLPGLGRIGVLVGLSSTADATALEPLAKQLAMHIAAAVPQSVSVASLDPELVARERAVLAEQARESGRPENIIEKMVEGRLRKFYEDSVLLEQTWVHDGESRVAKVIEDAAKNLGAPIEIAGFVRFALGEGIEASESDD